ncbi:MAG: ABC transporter ATP-binding protein [Planctomycetota bacterium]|nr:ABC transporter ATP-binding protein [Planctomycetota bacterium]
MIDIVNLWHHYGVRPTLSDVNLRIETGELVVVMGPNGMGKSTLLSLVAGILPPFKGHIEIDGKRRRRSIEEEKEIRRRVVYLPDTPWLPVQATAREFVLAVGRLYGVEEDRLFDHAERLLKLFDLHAVGDAPIASLSTGQRKKVGICAALITDAPVFVLDEPFSGGLDSSALLALQHVLKALAARDEVTILMAVPVPELVDALADRVAIIKEGRIIACDSPAKIRESMQMATLGEALEKIIHPERVAQLDEYLGERPR